MSVSIRTLITVGFVSVFLMLLPAVAGAQSDPGGPNPPDGYGFDRLGSYGGRVAGIVTDHAAAYVAAGTRLDVYDTTNRTDPALLTSIPFQASIDDVAMADTGILIAADQLYVVDVSTPKSARVVGSVPVRGAVPHVVAKGSHAFVASYDGILTIDVSIPSAPVVVATYTEKYATDLALHGDVLVGMSPISFYPLYDVNLFDVSDPTDIKHGGYVCQCTGLTRFLIWEDELLLYMKQTLARYDVSDLSTPKPIGSHKLDGYLSAMAVHDHTLYAAQSNGVTLIFDLTTGTFVPEDSIQLDRVTHGLAADKDTMLMAMNGKLVVTDISERFSPRLVTAIDIPAAIHRAEASGENQVALLTAGSSLQMVDISTPNAPVVLGQTDLGDEQRDQLSVGGTIAAVGGDTSYSLIDVADPSAPTLVSTTTVTDSITVLDIFEEYLLVGTERQGLQLFSIEAPEEPMSIGRYNTETLGLHYPVDFVLVRNNFAYIAWPRAIEIVDLSDPADPRLVGTIESITVDSRDVPISAPDVREIALGPDNLLLVAALHGFFGVDVTDPTRPETMFYIPMTARSIVFDNGVAFVSGADSLDGSYADMHGIFGFDIGVAGMPIDAPPPLLGMYRNWRSWLSIGTGGEDGSRLLVAGEDDFEWIRYSESRMNIFLPEIR